MLYKNGGGRFGSLARLLPRRLTTTPALADLNPCVTTSQRRFGLALCLPAPIPRSPNAMVVTTRISRWDLLTVNLLVAPRQPVTWISFGFVVTLVGINFVADQGLPTTPRAFFVLFFAIACAAMVFVSVMLLLILGFALLSPSHGILGEHVYSVQSDGVREQTAANDTLIKWGGAQDLVRTSTFILIRVAPALFHALPRRSFTSQAEFEQFWECIQALKRERRRAQA